MDFSGGTVFKKERINLSFLEQVKSIPGFVDIFNAVNDGVTIQDQTGQLIYANPAMARIMGFSDAADLIDMNRSDIWKVIEILDSNSQPISAEDLPGRRALRGEKTEKMIVNWRNRQSQENRWSEVSASPVYDSEHRVIMAVNIIRDITENKQAEDRIKYNYHHDSLTDLPNRLLFNEVLSSKLLNVARDHSMLGAVLIDLDRFKLINESLGHSIGDRLLQEVALRLKSILDDTHFLARLGGDEFGIVVGYPEQEDEVAKVCQRVLECLKQSFLIDRHELFVTPSIGIAMYPFDGDDSSTLLRNADTALYRAKEQGRNNFQFYTPGMNAKAFERLSLESTLRKALNNNEFVVYYIPQLEVETGKIVQLESLIRWIHPDLGLTFPDEFIELAETTGLIEEIGEWVLKTSLTQVKQWHDMGFTDLRSAINLSGRQFKQRHLVRIIHRILDETGFPPHLLELEVRENTVIENTQVVHSIMSELRKDGIKFAMDDFNAAHSSLKYIKNLPIDVLKIDRWGLKSIPVKEKDTAIVNSIINLAHSLGMTCVAEGVERLEQLQFLKQQKCDLVQGYLFSPPVEADKITDLLRKNAAFPIKI